MTREINDNEKHLLREYQHLMTPAERMVARSLVANGFDVGSIPKQIWARIWQEFPGVDRRDPWRLPIMICLRLLSEHRTKLHLPSKSVERPLDPDEP